MADKTPTNVSTAFEMLLEEVEAEVELVNKLGAKAFETGDYDRAREALERAGQLAAFRDKVSALRNEWQTLAPASSSEEEKDIGAERRNLGRLERGVRTPSTAYYRPILQTLAELGGSARMRDVLERVEQQMKGRLKPVDYDPLTSDPETPRWANATQWARYELVKQGLLKADSPRGIWEISEQGKHALQEGNV